MTTQYFAKGRTTLLLALPLLLMAANILWGSLDIPLNAMPDILLGREIEGHPSWSYIVWHSRVPQMLTATFCGAALATCGLLNPSFSFLPYLLIFIWYNP